MSFSSNTSPHSGQNLGGFEGSFISYPHLSHLYSGAPDGFGLPQLEQNFPWLIVPQEHVHPLA